MKFRSQRYATSFPIVLKFGSTRRTCVVSSISTSGACIKCDDDFAINDEVVVDYSFGNVRAVVKWTTPGKIGVVFKHALAPASLSRIRYAIQAAGHQTSHRSTFTELR